jgi:hypothetical protein
MLKGSQKKEEKQYQQPENILFALSIQEGIKDWQFIERFKGQSFPVKSFETAAEVFGIIGGSFFCPVSDLYLLSDIKSIFQYSGLQ